MLIYFPHEIKLVLFGIHLLLEAMMHFFKIKGVQNDSADARWK